MGHSQQSNCKGQALVEFTLVLPLLVLVLLAVFVLGMALYTASNASSAVKQPVLNKLDLAKAADGDEAKRKAKLLVDAYRDPLMGSHDSVDRFDIAASGGNRVTALLVGKKDYTVSLPGLPSPLNLTFTAIQPINANLFKPTGSNPIESVRWQEVFPEDIRQRPYTASVSPGDYGLRSQEDISTVLQRVSSVGTSISLASASEGCAPTALDIPSIINVRATADRASTLIGVPRVLSPPAAALPPTFSTFFYPAVLFGLAQAAETDLPLRACDGTDGSYNAVCRSTDNNDACHHKQRMACRMAYINQYLSRLVVQMGMQHGCSRAGWEGNSETPPTMDLSSYRY